MAVRSLLKGVRDETTLSWRLLYAALHYLIMSMVVHAFGTSRAVPCDGMAGCDV